MSETRLQDECNKAIRDCDIFVSLFLTKTGKFTEEEFDVSHQQF
jgi:internalin A